VLGLARSSEVEGYLLLASSPLGVDDIADAAALPEKVVNDGMTALTEAGFVHWDNARSCWHVTNWDKRQYASDRSTDRVAKHRASNADVTAYPRSMEQPIAVDASPPENRGQRTDTEQLIKPTPSSELVVANGSPAKLAQRDFDAWWSLYPRKVGKQAARRKHAVAVKRVNPLVLEERLCVHVEAWTRHGYETQFIPHPATWLEQGRWDDDPPPPLNNGRTRNEDRTDRNLQKFLDDMGGSS
jgi:hypothetical protein